MNIQVDTKQSSRLGKYVYGSVLLVLASCYMFLFLENPCQEPLSTKTFGNRISMPFALWQQENGQEFFFSEIAGGRVYVAEEGISYQIVKDKVNKPLPIKPRNYSEAMDSREASTARGVSQEKSVVVRESFGSPLAATGLERGSSTLSRITGNRADKWLRDNSLYNSLTLGEPWSGITVELRAYNRNVEKIFRVSPRADPQKIEVYLEGINNLQILANGELLLETDLGPVQLTKPVAYQKSHEDSLGHSFVEVAYVIKDNNAYGFAVSDYDSTEELIIDPLLASTFVGGSEDERYAYDDFAGHIYTGHPSIVEDSAGNVYIIGQTRSPDYPTTVGVIDASYNDVTSILKNDIVVTKLSADLSTIIASTYLGGSSEDNGASLAIGADGNIYILGFTRSRDFPVTTGGFDISYGGGNADAFIALLSADLTTLIASSYIGGSGSDYLYGLTIAPDDSLYLIGDTYSSRFPTRPGGYDVTLSGSNDAFVLRMTADLSTVSAGTLLGGTGYDYGRQISLTSTGSVVALGNTTSSDFPTTSGVLDQTANGGHDIFITVLDGTLATVLQSTYLGGSLDDIASSFVQLSTGQFAIAGATQSTNFPTVATGYDKTHNGTSDGTIALLADNLTALQAVTFVGGTKWDDIYEIRRDTTNVLFIGGWTQSPDLPVGEQSYDTSLSGASDAFLGKFSANLATRESLTYLGGAGNVDYILSLLLSQSGDLLTLGITDSSDFPVLNGAQNTLSGGRDTFVAKITTNLLSDSYIHHLIVRDSLDNSSASTTAGTSLVVKIEARDELDRVVTSYNGNKSVVLYGPAVSPGGSAPTCTNSSSSDITLGNATTLTFTNGVATCALKLYQAEVTTLDAVIGSINSTASPADDLDLTVSHSSASRAGSIINANPNPATSTNAVTVSVVVLDAYGNSIGGAAATATVTIAVAGSNTATPVMSYSGNGVFSGSYTPVHSGSDRITGTLNGQAILQDGDGNSNGTFFLPVNALSLHHYEVRSLDNGAFYDSLSAEVYAHYTLAVVAKDSQGNTVTNHNESTFMTFSGASPSPGGSNPVCDSISFGIPTLLVFSNGVATCDSYLYNAETSSIDVTDGTVNSNGNAAFDLDINLWQNSNLHYEITGSSSQQAGSSQVITISAVDGYGNIDTGFAGAKSLTFSGASVSPSGNTPTATNQSGTPINLGSPTSLTFVAGQVTSTLTLYVDETASIDVTDGTLSSENEDWWDLDIVATHQNIVSPSQSVISTNANPGGTCGPVGISVLVRDQYGNRVRNATATVVVTVAGANAGTPAVTNEGNGTYTAQYLPVNGGADNITATVDALPITQDTDGIASDGTYQQTIDGSGPNVVTWEGDDSSDWHTATNWVGSVPPTTCSDVVIDGAVTFQPALDVSAGSVQVNSVSLGATTSSTLTLNFSSENKALVTTVDFTIGAHGTLTHHTNLDTEIHRLFVAVGGNMSIASGGAVDVTRKGYDYTSGLNGTGPGGGAGDSSGGYGGSHGGFGGGSAYGPDNSAAQVYGFIRTPTALGSAGGGGYSLEGGGAIKLTVSGTLNVLGNIRANGYAAGAKGGGGAGGSVWLVAATISGSGDISADGASGRNLSGIDGTGGGGRIALYYDNVSFTGNISAYRNDGGDWPSSGTIFIKQTGAANGDLILDGGGRTGAYYGTIPIGEDLVVDNLYLLQEGGLALWANLTVLASQITTTDGNNLNLYAGSLNLSNINEFSYDTFSGGCAVRRYGAAINIASSTLSIGGGGEWWEFEGPPAIGDTQPVTDIVMEDSSRMYVRITTIDNPMVFNSLTMRDQSVMYSDLQGAAKPINFVLNSLSIEDDAGIYTEGETGSYLGGGQADGSSASGGGYGGRGGRTDNFPPSETYGDLTWPIEIGSGGGGSGQWNGTGGGIIKFQVAGVANINGWLSVSGLENYPDGGGGSGGSILIDTQTFTGTGSIDATGARGYSDSGGGGGRIAVYYENNTFSGSLFAQGGASLSFSTNRAAGGAGTVFLKDKAQAYGDLIIDNQGIRGEETPIDQNLTLRSLSILNNAKVVINSGRSVTLLAPTINTTADASLTIEEEGEFNALNLGTLSNFSVTNHGLYNHSGDTLTIGSGLVWNENSTLKTFGNSQSIRHLVVEGTLMFGNQDISSPTSFDSIVVRNGGVLKAGDIAGGYEEPIPYPPVAAYNFDEGSGVAFSDLAGSNNGSLTNTAWSSSGIYGSALSFNGNTSYASVPDAAALDLTTAFTLESWIYPTSVPDGWATVIIKERTGGLAYSMALTNGANVFVGANFGGSEQSFTSAATVTFNTWTHLAATFDGSILKLYINGVLAESTPFEGTLTPSNRPLRIGGATVWDEDFAGLIDNVRIYSRALTASEIASNMGIAVETIPPFVPPVIPPTTLNLDVNSLTIDAGGIVDLDGAGYSYSSGNTGSGPGGGNGNGTTGAGATHGGIGGSDGSSTAGSTYGSVTEPIELGSAAGSCPGYCQGGGALRLNVNNSLQVNGTIRANGVTAPANGSSPPFDGAITVYAAGDDIWGNSDSFRFVYWPLSGDGEIQAELVSMDDTNSLAKAGVMIRETLADDSRHAMTLLVPDGGVRFNRRHSTGGIVTDNAGTNAIAPYWLRIKRVGNVFTSYDSADGSNWTLIGTDTINMAADVYFGLAVTSRNASTLNTSVFKNISSDQPLPASWTGTDIGSVSTPGYNTLPPSVPVYPQGGGGAGGSIWINATALSGSGQITANGSGSTTHGAGGGGRIAIYYDNSTFNGGVHAYGGNSGVGEGGAGTVYWKGDASPDPFFGNFLATDPQGGSLVIDNGGQAGETHLIENLTVQSLTLINSARLYVDMGTTLTLQGTSFISTADSSFLIWNGSFVAPDLGTISNLETFQIWGSLTLAPDVSIHNVRVHYDHLTGAWQNIANLTIGNGGILELRRWATTDRLELGSLTIQNGGRATHFSNWIVQDSILPIKAQNITIEAGGGIDVSEGGYTIGEGPGHPTGLSGAGYGGVGGNGTTGLGGSSYGSMAQPLDVGSTALAAYSGGGAVLLEVENTLTVDGEIRANGGSGPGGSSGGSVFLSANTLTGSGLISANGGDALDGSGGGGGGGRIAIYVFDQTFIPDGGSISIPGLIADPIGGLGLNVGDYGTLYFSVADHYEVTGLATQVSGTSQIIDLQIIDNYGLPFYWNFTRPVIFSGPGQANINGTLLSPTWSDRDNNPLNLGQATTLDFTDGAASSSMTLYKVETTAVDVTDGTITSFANPTYDLDVTVTAQEATLELGSDINAVPSVVEINNSVNVTVTVKDQWGNAKTTGGDTVTLSVAGANPQVLVVIDNGNGTYSSSYVPINPGIDRITGTLNTKAITGDLDGLSDGTFYITVTAGVANHLEITGPASVIAGTGYHITIKAVAASGAIDGGYSGDRQITLSGALAGPLGHAPTCRDIDGQDIPFGSPMTLEFVLGETTCQMRLYRTGATEVDASDGSINTTGNVNWDLNTTVNNLLAEGITGRISATPNPVERNFAVTIYVATFDSYGNALTSGGQAVTLQVTGVNNTTPAVTDLGDGTYSATYTPTNGGQDLITGTLAGLVITADTEGTSDGVFHETVTATITPTHLEVSGASSQVAGSSQTITISARDNAGDTAFTYSGDKTITLSGPLAALSGTVPTCTDRFGADIALGSATTLTFTNGQATCSLKLYRAEVTSVDATDGTLSSAGDPDWDLDVTVSAGAGAGSESILSASPNPAEVGATVTVTLQAKDAYGNVKTAAGDTVTFAVAGANPAGALSVSYIGSGQYQATYAPSSTGADQISSTINTQAVTKDTDGTSDGTYNENIISYHLEVTGSASQTAGTSQVITISKRRQDGAIDTSYSGDHSLTLSGPLAAPDTTVPTCTDKTATDIALGTATTLTFTNGQATCTLKLYRAEVTAVDATDGTYSTAADPTWDLDVTVSAAPGHSSESILSVSPNPQEVGGTVTVTVQAIDTYQNPLATGGDTVTIAVAGANPGASLLVTDLTNGQYQATYTPAATGMDSVTASINGAALTKDTDGTSDGTYNENIVSYHFEVTGSGTQDSGSTQIVTIQLRRNDGTLRASYSGDHALTLSGPLASPDGTAPTCRDKSGVDIALGSATTLAFVGGQATCVLTLYRAETTSVDAGDGTYDSTGNAAWDLDVVVSEETGSASESILSAAPNPGIVGSSVTVTVQAIDTYGNPRTVGGDTVTLAVAGANPSASLSISYIGGGQYQASYIPTATGTDQITGSINSAALTQDADGTSDGTYHEDIISYHFEVTGVGVQEAGTSQVVTLTLKKNDGSTEVNYLGDHAVTLSGPLAAPDGTAPTCSDKNATDINLGSSTTLTFAGGVATCTLKLYRREVTAVDASDGTYTSAANPSWDLDITVDAAGVDLNESVLDVAPNPVEIGNQVTASVTVRDQFQNLRTAGTDTVTLAVAGANPQVSLTVNYQGGGVYSGTYTPNTQGQDAVSGTVNTAAITQDTDGTSNGIYLLDVVAFHLEVTGSGTQVAGSSQIATITVYRNDGSIDNTYVGDHAVTLSGPGVSPDGTTPTCTDKDGVLRNLGTATTLTFVGGQATCTLTLYRSETTSLDATDGSYSSAANGAWDLDIVVSQASGLGAESILSVSPDPQEVGQVVAISVQAVDTYGNLRSSGGDAVTIAVSGANPGVSLPVTDLGTGIYQASYTPTNTGEDQITGSINSGAILKDSDGVSDGTYHEDIISYHLVVTGSATQTAGASQVITITVTRHDGVTLASYAGDHLLTLSGPLAGLDGTVPTCQDKSGVDRQLGTATTLSFAGGVATCTLKLYRAEVTAVDATDGTYSSAANPAWDLDVTVSPAAGDGSESILSASPNPGEVGVTITLSVQIRDSYQNPTSSLGELITLAVNGANSVPVVTMTHSGGALYQGTYSPVNPGQDLITGLVNGSAISQDTDGTSDGTYHEDIVAYHLEVTGSGTQIAGNMQLLTVTARYNDGSVNTAYAGNQLITLSGPQAGLDGTLPTCDDNLDVARALNTPTTLTFSNGVATCELRLYRAEVTSIDATDGTYSSTANPSWDLDVTVSAGAGSGSQSTLSASPNPGEIAHAISLEVIVLDSYRNPTTGGDNIIFALNGANSQSGLTGAHTGGGVYQASYTPTNPGMDLITAMVNSQAVVYDTDGTSDGTYHEAINAFHIEVTGTATQEAGSAQIITLSLRDHSGALNTSYVGDHSMTISGPGGSTSGQTPTCQDQSGVMRPLGTGSTLLFSAGQATCLLTLYHAETVSVDASDGTYSSFNDPSWDLDLVVTGKTGGAIDGTLGASPNPTNRGSLVTVEVEASDEYGNELAPDTVVNAVVSGANNTALVLTKASPRIYRGNYTATNAGEDLITATVAAQGLTKDSDGVSDGVYHLTVQEDRATKHKIRGKVYWREPAGEPVKGVIVSDGSHTALSNGHGNYELSDVSDGTYTISGLYEGYEVRVEAGLNPVNVSGGDINDIDLVVWREAPLTLYAPWNGFLDNVVINEVFNIGSENLEVTISLYKMSGSQVGRGGETHFTVKPKEQIDIIINDLNGFEEDRYGVLVVNMSHGNYSGQVSYYKLTPTGSFRSTEELGEDFDYAFPNPFVAPVTGTSWVTFNTHQPSHKPEEVGYLVPNWLTIINGEEDKSQYFRIRKYDESGKRITIPDNTGTVSQVCQARKNELRCRVSALGRIDIDGGHVYPGPERVGLIEIAPEDSSAQYVASLVRYGVNSPPEIYSNRYSYGASLQARQGLGREQVLSVSTAGGSENWVEIANVLSNSARAQVEIVDYKGQLTYSRSIRIKARAQVHLSMADILGQNSSGVLRVHSDKPGSIITQSASYYLSDSDSLVGVTLTQPQDTFGRKVHGTYNRYLNSYNWLKVINLVREKRNITLIIYREGDTDRYTLAVPGYGGYDLPLHDMERFKLEPNTLGMFELQDSIAGSISAELLRIKPGPSQTFDFTMATKLR